MGGRRMARVVWGSIELGEVLAEKESLRLGALRILYNEELAVFSVLISSPFLLFGRRARTSLNQT